MGDRPAACRCEELAARVEALENEVTSLTAALRSRDTIGQAKGLLMARHGLGSDAAFERLTRLSQKFNEKVAVLAAVLVDEANDGAAESGAGPP